ncbi:MAG: ADP-ribosylation factor-like protein [Thermoplasmata archaeon]
MKAAIGLEALDRGLDGGLQRPSSFLLSSEVMAEKRSFAEQFIATGLRAGETCLYLDLYGSPRLARHKFARFGDLPLEHLVVASLGPSSDGSFDEALSKSVPGTAEILERVEALLVDRQPTRVILDSLDLLAEELPKPAFDAFLRDFTDLLKTSGAVAGLLFVESSYGNGGTPEVLERSEYRFEFRSALREGALIHKLRLSPSGQNRLATRWIPFVFREGRGLVLHFPRVLVAGPSGSGVSTVVRKLSQSPSRAERRQGPAAFDYGHAEGAGWEAELVGTPGKKRFAFLLPVLMRGTQGLLLVIDSTRPGKLDDTIALREMVGKKVPTVVVANKADLEGAMTMVQIREGLDLEDEIPIAEASASKGHGLQEALEQLIDVMIWGWAAA